MAEKRKLMAEMERVFRKVDEGVELFEDTMAKMAEANSDNQREKFQDDLKKEIKKLQRLRDQIKGWQNSNEVKDKDKLAQYRKIIENRMEQFKDIERENKTKPHSKQGLNAEEKMDPRERERAELIDFLSASIQTLNEQMEALECEVERAQGPRRRGKAKAPSRLEEELKHRLDRHKHHVQQLELVMRLLNNETLDCAAVKDIREDIEDYVARNGEDDFQENTFLYDDLNMGDAAQQLGGVTHIGTFDEPEPDPDEELLSDDQESPKVPESSNGKRPPKGKAAKTTSSASKDSEGPMEVGKSRQQSGGGSLGAAPLVGGPVVGAESKSTPSTPLRLTSQRSVDGSPPSGPPGPVGAPGPASGGAPGPPSAPGAPNGGPTPPVLGYAKAAASAKAPEPLLPAPPALAHLPPSSGPTPLIPPSNNHLAFPKPQPPIDKLPEALGQLGLEERSSPVKAASLQNGGGGDSAEVPALKSIAGAAVELGGEAGMLFLAKRGRSEGTSEGSQEAVIPPILGASPLGRSQVTTEQKAALRLLDAATSRLPLPSDSERLRPYISRNPCKQPLYYAQAPPPLSDTLEYFHRLAPETLFFIFYYLEGTKAQYLAAKALKKQSWRFHKKYMMWFQRHEDPTAITDDYEQGTYVYFDFEKWSQRKKESFTFEYQYLEDRDLS